MSVFGKVKYRLLSLLFFMFLFYQYKNCLSCALNQAIIHFHLGLKLDAAFQPYQDRFQPEPFFKALKRGNLMNIDLFHKWDPWSVMDKDIEQVRADFNILPKN